MYSYQLLDNTGSLEDDMKHDWEIKEMPQRSLEVLKAARGRTASKARDIPEVFARGA